MATRMQRTAPIVAALPANTTDLDDDGDAIDEDIDLPPLDADEGDEKRDADLEDLPGLLEDDGGRDDSTASELDIGSELETADEVAPSSRDSDLPLDVGALDEDLDLEDEGAGIGDGQAPEGVEIDDDPAIEDARGVDDGGMEGTGENPEDGVDEALLPDMDDGEANQADAEVTMAEALLAGLEVALPPWSTARWVALQGAGARVPCCAVAVAAGRVAAAGEVLLYIEEGGHAARQLPFSEGAITVGLADDALLAATPRGKLLVTRGDRGNPASLASWDAAIGGPSNAGPLELVATADRFWIRSESALHCLPVDAKSASALRDDGVLAIAASAGVLLAVSQDAGPPGSDATTASMKASVPVIERFRGDDEGWRATPLPPVARRVAEGAPASLRVTAAASGRLVAIDDGTTIALSRDSGATFEAVELGRVLAVTFAGDGLDAPLLVLVASASTEGRASRGPLPVPSESPSLAYLVEVTTPRLATRVASLALGEGGVSAPDGSPGRVAMMAWDASREVVWIASNAGLVAMGRQRPH